MEAFIAKRDEYPVDRGDAVAILNKYNKKKPNVQVPSEGTAFTQKGKKNNKNNKGKGKSSNKKRWMMERKATNQRMIGLPTKLAICVAKQVTVSKES